MSRVECCRGCGCGLDNEMRLWLCDRRAFPPRPADAAEPAVWLFLQTSTAADGSVIRTWSGMH